MKVTIEHKIESWPYLLDFTDTDQLNLFYLMCDGEEIGNIFCYGNGIVTNSFLKGEYRGMGLGLYMYEVIFRTYGSLQSDIEVSTLAAPIYKKLAKKLNLKLESNCRLSPCLDEPNREVYISNDNTFCFRLTK